MKNANLDLAKCLNAMFAKWYKLGYEAGFNECLRKQKCEIPKNEVKLRPPARID